MRLGLILKLALLAALSLMVALVAVAKSIDVASYRAVLAKLAKESLGRDLEVKGRLSLRLSLTPSLQAEDVVLSNAAWSSQPQMLHVKSLTADIGLVALLGRQVRIQRLILDEPELLLESDAHGRANWQFGEVKGIAPVDQSSFVTPTSFAVGQIAIKKGKILYRDAASKREDVVMVDKFSLDAPIPGAPVGVLAGGTWNGRHYDVSGTLGSAGQFNDFLAKTQGKSFPVKLKAVLPGAVGALDGTVSAEKTGPHMVLKLTTEVSDLAESGRMLGLSLPALGAVRFTGSIHGPASAPMLSEIDAAVGRKDAVALSIKGGLREPLALRGVDLLVTAEGESLSGLNKAFDAGLPQAGPYRASARITDTADGWRFADLKAVVGRSDMAGEAQLHLNGKRPALEARLISGLVALDELTGQDADTGKADEKTSRRLFSDSPLPLAGLNSLNADLTWKAERVTEDLLSLQQAELTAHLRDGKLAVSPVSAAMAGGRINAELAADVTGKQPQVQLAVDADKFGLGEVLLGLRLTDSLRGGKSTLKLRLKGSGATLHALMAKASGESVLVAGEGKVEGSYADAIALDVLRQLSPWTDGKDTEMKCLVSRFVVTDGLAKSDSFLFDTAHMTVQGQGSLNLGLEQWDMTLTPRPKDISLLSMAVPLDVQGPMTQPGVTPNKGAIVKGLAGAATSVVLGPLGLLVPFISTGTMDDNPCLSAVAQARKGVAPVKKPAAKPAKPAKNTKPQPFAGGLLDNFFGK